MRNCTVAARRSILGKDVGGLSVILLAASQSKKMKGMQARSLISLAPNLKLIEHQIGIITDTYPHAEIIVVVGYESYDISRVVPRRVRLVVNQLYETTHIGNSIYLGLMNSIYNNVILIYGDLLFNKACIDGLTQEPSCALVTNEGKIDSKEVGVVVQENNIHNFIYGSHTKWCQIVYLADKECEFLRRISTIEENQRRHGFELLNDLIEVGGSLKAIDRGTAINILEIDSPKQIAQAAGMI